MNPVQRLVIANFSTGYETDREPFLINNDAFPVLQNFYAWRGKVLKKRGTFLLGRLRRFIPANATRPHSGTSTIGILSGGGALGSTSLISVFSLQAGANIVPGSISFSDGTNTYTDNSLGVITGTPAGSGTINYATSVITISGGAAGGTLAGSFQYNPNLPVMGIEDFSVVSAEQTTSVFFDTVYSYQFDQTNNIFYDTSFYKGSLNPVVWSGQTYQQFWSTNYYGAMWVTNNKPGFHFKAITGITQNNPGVITIVGHGLITGDKIWVNQVGGMTQINGQTLSVTRIDANTFSIGVDTSGYSAYTSGGIAQYLTSGISGQDGIKWYDGDPTASSGLGWVNFAPPLDNTATPSYLVGALAIIPFKDRLLFFGPYTQTSAAGTPTLYQDRVIYSQNGTPFYNTLVPTNPANPQTAPSNSSAWYQNVTGFGGFISAGIQQAIVTVTNNEDVLLVDFINRKTKIVYTGNDLIPFLFYNINSELGTESTFSAITLDSGALSMGQYGIAMTTQNSAQRIDLLIPDQIFEVKQANFGVNRVCAVRDFRNEFVYFTYPSNENREGENFPTQTLVFNYRDNTWAIFLENFTTYGNFRYGQDTTWATLPYLSWSAWTDPWNTGKGSTDYPYIAGGNQQGFVLLKDAKGITEAQSQYIQSITISGTTVTINSPNHSLSAGEYIYILGCIGVANINATIRQILTVVDENSFRIDTVSPNSVPSGTYLGGGTYTRLTLPVVLSKQFPTFWEMGKKARIGTQKYLFDETSDGELTVGLFVNQNSSYSTTSFGANQLTPFNSAMVFTQTVLTSPEPAPIVYSTQQVTTVGNGVLTSFTFNLFSLTATSGTLVANTVVISIRSPNAINFIDDGSGGFDVFGQAVSAGSSVNYTTGDVTVVVSVAIASSSVYASFYYLPVAQFSANQSQIWHRMNSSLVGDTVQFGLTLSDSQMRDYSLNNSEIVLHAVVMDLYPSGVLSQ